MCQNLVTNDTKVCQSLFKSLYKTHQFKIKNTQQINPISKFYSIKYYLNNFQIHNI